MHNKSIFLLSVFLLLSLLLAPTSSVAAQAPERSAQDSIVGAKSLPLTAPNLIQDPSLEAAWHNTAVWQQESSNADSPVCRSSNTIDCHFPGVSVSRTGTRWAMFGIHDWEDPETINPEVASLSQTVTFPSCGASLQFYLWIGQAPAGSNANDVFNVKIDNNTIFSKSAIDITSYSAYTLVTLDVSAYANGTAHTIEFHSVTSDQPVIFNLDDISLTRTCVTISGNAGIAAATVDYVGSTNGSTTANGSGAYSFDVPFDWSGTVTPSKAGYTFVPVDRTYTNLTTDQTGQNYVATGPTISGNVGVSGVTLSYTDVTPKTATSDPNGDYSFIVSGDWSGTVTPSHPCYTFTPSELTYTNVVTDQTGQDYTLTPVPAAGCAEISVDIAGNNEAVYPISTQGTLTQKFFPAVNKGPVKIHSTVPILGAERVIYPVGGTFASFSEMIGLPSGHLDNIYWLPWYNNKDLNTQLRIANVDITDATVHVFIGGTEVTGSPYTLTPGASRRLSFPGIDKGPVKIESDVNIVAAERVIYTVNGVDTSFSEMMALPESQLDKIYWLPRYNNVDLDSQLRIANVDITDATVHVYMGGTEVAGSPFTVPAGKSIRKSFPGINKGLVKIESDVNIVAAERVIYKFNGTPTSFFEMMGLPAGQLDTTYWLPWYNNVELDTHLRFGVP